MEFTDLCDLSNFAQGFPHEAFTRLRREAPVWWHPPTAHTPDGEGFWVVSRHAPVVEVFQDAKTFSSERGGERKGGGTLIQDSPAAGLALNMMDDPRHRRIRSLVNKGFTPRTIGALEGELTRRTREILASVVGRGPCDFVRDVARELPLQAICMLLGVPQEDRQLVCDDIDRGMEHLDRVYDNPDPEAAAALGRVAAYGNDLIARKRREPADDMLSIVVHAELPGEAEARLSDAELGSFFVLLFTAGSETTRKAIAGGMHELVKRPAELARLRADPTLLSTAVEEMVRWTSPSAYKRRTATCDVELRGEKIRAGDKVTVWEASANRDEEVFDEPFRFDVGRQPNPHVGFGAGLHFCLGANLARLELQVMFRGLLAEVGEFSVVGEPEMTRDNRLLGLKRLPMLLEPKAG
jgi:cytochrome P450